MQSRSLGIATWNIGHQAGYNGGWRTPAAEVAATIATLAVDVVVITEFVPRVCPDLPERLGEIGLQHVLQPEQQSKANYVLIASKEPIELGRVPSPDFHIDAQTNAMHVWLPTLQLDLFGVRVPAYEKAADVRQMWEWLDAVREEFADARAVLAGDLNVSGSMGSSTKAARIGFGQLQEAWQHVAPTEGASYFARSKGRVFANRIDHLFATKSLGTGESAYVCQTARGHVVNQGSDYKRIGYLSDHAILSARIRV